MLELFSLHPRTDASAQTCLNEGQRNAKKGWNTYGNE
jgi:hypothetical protein